MAILSPDACAGFANNKMQGRFTIEAHRSIARKPIETVPKLLKLVKYPSILHHFNFGTTDLVDYLFGTPDD
jgi:hypothetical protein